jgi:hypothetical protein
VGYKSVSIAVDCPDLFHKALRTDTVCRWPVTMYSEHARRITDKLWEETLDELSFANVRSVLKGCAGED